MEKNMKSAIALSFLLASASAQAQFVERPPMCEDLSGKVRTCNSIKREHEAELEKTLNELPIVLDLVEQTEQSHDAKCSKPQLQSACRFFCSETYSALEKKYQMIAECVGSTGARITIKALFNTKNPEVPQFLESKIKVKR